VPPPADIRADAPARDVEIEEEPDDRPIPAVASQLLLGPRHPRGDDDGAWDNWRPADEEEEEEEALQEDLPPEDARDQARAGGPPPDGQDPQIPGPGNPDPAPPPRPRGRTAWLLPHPAPEVLPAPEHAPLMGGVNHPWCQAPPAMPPRLPRRVRARVLRAHAAHAEALPAWDVRPRRPAPSAPEREAQGPQGPEGVRRPAALAELGHVHEVVDSHGVYSLASASTAAPRRWRPARGEQGPRVLFEVREGIVISGPTGAGTGGTGAGDSDNTRGAGLPSTRSVRGGTAYGGPSASCI